MATFVQDEHGNVMAFFMAVPLVPPSANRVVRHTNAGRHYVPKDVQEFDHAVRLFARGHSIQGKEYKVTARVILPPGKRGDVDNFQKPLLDSLVKAGVIDSDAKVRECSIRKERGREPLTEISVEVWKG